MGMETEGVAIHCHVASEEDDYFGDSCPSSGSGSGVRGLK